MTLIICKVIIQYSWREAYKFHCSVLHFSTSGDVKRRPIRQRPTILTKAGHVSSILAMRIFVFYCAPAAPSSKNWSVILRFNWCLPPFVPLALNDGYHNWREGRWTVSATWTMMVGGYVMSITNYTLSSLVTYLSF